MTARWASAVSGGTYSASFGCLLAGYLGCVYRLRLVCCAVGMSVVLVVNVSSTRLL